MTLDKVVLDSLRIVKAVRVHLDEKDCRHSIKEIINEALGLADLAPEQRTDVTATFVTSKNGDYIVV